MVIMTCKSVLLILVSLVLVLAIPTPSYHVVHEQRNSPSSSWVKRDRVPADDYMLMRIALAQSELEDAEFHLMSLSHPESPKYGQHWTSDDIIDRFRPSEVTEAKVRQWLIDSGIDADRITHSENKAWFVFYATADEAENLLHTEFHDYEHVESGTMVPSCEQYHLPKHVSPHVDYVTPGILLLPPTEPNKARKKKVKRHPVNDAAPSPHTVRRQTHTDDLSNCSYRATPPCIAALYQIPPTQGTPNPNNSLGIFESGLQFWRQDDLDVFLTNWTSAPNGTHPVAANIDGGVQSTEDPDYAGFEVSLDLVVAYPIVYPQTITDYQVDDLVYQTGLVPTPLTSGFNTFLDALDGSYCTSSAYNLTGNDPNLDPVYPDPYTGGWRGDLECGTKISTNVISISYGGQEVDVPLSYQKRQCLEFLKLGMQGVSILVASGDSGAANYPPEFAFGTPDCMGPNSDILNPTWPNSCPWVTAVGATQVNDGYGVDQPESAALTYAGGPIISNYSSGGGFSNIYAAPAYQQAALGSYFQAYDPGFPYYSEISPNTDNITEHPDPVTLAGNTGGAYNRIGRGYPDVSANGKNIAIQNAGRAWRSSGTSGSAPLFAAVINRINEERLNANKTSLGFLNPSLYSNPSMLNDITDGYNLGCNSSHGFDAVPGWDPVTGLGTPNYPKMLEYYMSLP